MNLFRASVILLCALLIGGGGLSSAFAYHAPQYYEYEYFGPARTWSPTDGIYYPGRPADSFGWFRSYRQYTHAAYRPQWTANAYGYLGTQNSRYFS